MAAERDSPESIDGYIADFPPEVRKILEELRRTIRAAAPEAVEAIKYQIPTFVLHGNLVHFAAFTHHIGLYPAPREVPEFEADLAPYAGGKGTVRFPLDRPLPLDLVTRIVEYRAAENLAKATARRRRQAVRPAV